MKVKLRKELPYLLFILPAFIVYTILTVIPLVQTPVSYTHLTLPTILLV